MYRTAFSANFSLLPKLGLKIGGGRHTTPALSRKGSFLPFRASPLHQHTARRLRNHPMSRIRRLLLLVFSVKPFKIDQNKNQNRSIDKV